MQLVVTLLAVLASCYAVDINSICGRARHRQPVRSKATNYILGGVGTSNNEFPWIVSLRYRRDDSVVSGHFCAGSIVSEKAVVTAAHCVENASPNRLVVVFQDQFGRLSMRLLEKIIAHPDYNKKIYDYDIAVLVLKDRLDFDGVERRLSPICLPKLGDQVEHWPTCMVAGWGTLNYGDKRGSYSLLKTDVEIIERDVCRRSYVHTNSITTRMFCAGDFLHGNKGTCQGDSGGPLMCFREDFRYQLSGVTSWGLNCGQAKFPGVFTDVEKVLGFVVRHASL